MGARWYLVRTSPRSESIAANQLERDGYDIFLPCVKVLSSEISYTESPLFPGYLFLRHDVDNQPWPNFRTNHRITGWLKCGDEIPWLSDQIIADLVKRLAEINQRGGQWHRYLVGEKVEIVSGAITGFAEVIRDAKSPNVPVQVVLDFMGRLVRTEVPFQDIKLIKNDNILKPRIPRRTRGRGRYVRRLNLVKENSAELTTVN